MDHEKIAQLRDKYDGKYQMSVVQKAKGLDNPGLREVLSDIVGDLEELINTNPAVDIERLLAELRKIDLADGYSGQYIEGIIAGYQLSARHHISDASERIKAQEAEIAKLKSLVETCWQYFQGTKPGPTFDEVHAGVYLYMRGIRAEMAEWEKKEEGND